MFYLARQCFVSLTVYQLPQRRPLAQRVKADENAMSKHLRQPSNVNAGASRLAAKDVNAAKPTQPRTALGEVTLAAVNRKVRWALLSVVCWWLTGYFQDPAPKVNVGKPKEPASLKRGRSDSNTVAQRVPLGPGRSQIAPPVANAINVRAPLARPRIPVANTKRVAPRIVPPVVVVQDVEVDVRLNEPASEMDVEEDLATVDRKTEAEANLSNGEQEVEAMIGIESGEEDVEESAHLPPTKIQRIWPEITTERRVRCEKEVQAIREMFHDEVDMYDTTMVSEYAEEIFEYMCDLEVCFSFVQRPTCNHI